MLDLGEEIRGKVALVTGSTSGIGHGIARALAAQGCDVMLNGLGDEDIIVGIQEEIAEMGVQVAYSDADMRDPQAIAELVNRTTAELGAVDIVVNNAGIQFVSPIAEFPVDKWNDIIAINLSSAFHTIRAASPIMAASGWGRIINVSSAHALRASPFKAAYVAAKHGISGLTKCVALELAEQNVTVNAIAPGYVKTPLVEGQIADTARARNITEEEVVRDVMLLAQPTRQLIDIDQVADLAVYLCSHSAAAITGSTLSIDGGWTAK